MTGHQEPTLLDRPAPGRGYIVFLLALLLAACGLAAAAGAGLADAGRLEQIGGTAFIAALVGLTLVPLHAAFRTAYEVDGSTLRLRSGFVIRATIATGEVASVERAGVIPRVLGWGGGRGLANRFTDGLRLTLVSGAVYYISPSDPAAFADRLMAVAPGDDAG